ncbi:LIC_12337 family protein [Leptospira wolffii]|uniref:Uncharacterized protein n=1 Tax=Leptospira wolffii TaxID=409998 RepID=A0A2M9ZCL1_9LEPT|nr:hypothetical protein [Leptospira wolffii]EPG67719.1 hypothetical protein LEP1GSC061_0144 [Leptospira wolffii serovar Khorat str. Khorat-H2]PJZ66139.1 hypothetical protein CH371_07550 [Leptospira wolffii]
MKKIFTLGFAKKAVLVLFVFFGVSLGFKLDFGKKNSANPLPIRLNVSHLQPLHASADQWGFVRGSATWARGNSLFMDDVIGSIQANPALVFFASQAGGITQHNFSTTAGTNFTITLRLNDSFSASSTVYPSTKTFKNYLELRTEGTDGTNSNDIALQFYWDDNPRDSTQNGALVKYRLQMLNPAVETGIADIESYIYSPDVTPGGYYESKGYSNQGLVQVYSWDNKLANDTEIAKNATKGRVILEEMDNKTVFCFKTVVRILGAANLLPGTVLDSKGFCSGTGDEYYKLAYSQKLTGNLEVTAKSGWEEPGGSDLTTNNGNLCAPWSISLNYGLFNVNGFVSDHVAAVDIPADYVQATRVDNLYLRIGDYGKSGQPTGTPGVDYDPVQWDNLKKATIDALDIQFATSPPI